MKKATLESKLTRLGIEHKVEQKNKVTQVIAFIVNGKTCEAFLDNFSDNVKLALVTNNDYSFFKSLDSLIAVAK